jgi:hypothetical protein
MKLLKVKYHKYPTVSIEISKENNKYTLAKIFHRRERYEQSFNSIPYVIGELNDYFSRSEVSFIKEEDGKDIYTLTIPGIFCDQIILTDLLKWL